MMTQATEASEYLANKTKSFHESDIDHIQSLKNEQVGFKKFNTLPTGIISTQVDSDAVEDNDNLSLDNDKFGTDFTRETKSRSGAKLNQSRSFIKNPPSPENKPKMYETPDIHSKLRESSISTRSHDNLRPTQPSTRQERRSSTAPAVPKHLETEAYYAETRLSPGRSKLETTLLQKDPNVQPSLESASDINNQFTDKDYTSFKPDTSNETNSIHEQLDSIERILNHEEFDHGEHGSFESGTPDNNASLPPDSNFPQIPTKEALETYRQNAKKSHDPEVQLDFAKYLIETAALVLENHGDHVDPQTARKLHNTLITEALKWTKRLSSQGIGLGKGAYPDAQFFLANCYNNGSLGLPVDHDKAFNLYVQASKQNHPAATYRTGVCYEFGAGTKRDHHRALQFFRKAAALGDAAAMFKVGMVLLKGGLGQQSNAREGITWLKRAAASADEENPHALHELASCYEKGGIPSIIADASYARELYTQAAQLGYVHSQFKMGVCYEQGLLTCPIDPRRSIAWFTRGAEQGDPECELALSGWYLTGSEGVLKQSDTEAYLWARKAADKGLAKAEYAVGYYSEVGIGVKQELEEARRWFMRAAAQGNKRAMERLTELKKLGTHRRNGTKSKEDGSCTIS